jgi:hypothetical protein
MDAFATELAKMEYERLSAEIASIQSENNELAHYAVIAAATVCAIIVTHKDQIPDYFHLLKALPFIISVLFSFRIFALYMRVELISKYIETNFEKTTLQADYPGLGWEAHLNANIRRAKIPRSFSQVSAILFWLALDILALIFWLH